MKRRVAMFGVGGVGAGIFSQGLPTIGKIVERLAERFEVTYYSLAPTDPGFEPRGFRLRSPSSRPAWLAIGRARWAALLARFYADHRRSPYDLLVSFWAYPMGTFVVGLSRLVRRPSIVMVLGSEVADVPSIGYGELRRPLARRLVLATCAGASTLVTISTYQKALLEGLELARRDVRVIPWGADRFQFYEVPKSREPPLKIVHVANLTPVKDQTTLLEAFATLRARLDARLRIVGPDYMGGRIQALAVSLGLRGDVEFVGPVPHHAVAAHYRWADMFLLTSLSEGQNGALTEALANGVLAVSTRVGLAADLGDEAAVIVEMKSPCAIAAAIERIAGDPAAWEARVRNAVAWSKEHDFEWTIDRLTDVVLDTIRLGR